MSAVESMTGSNETSLDDNNEWVQAFLQEGEETASPEEPTPQEAEEAGASEAVEEVTGEADPSAVAEEEDGDDVDYDNVIEREWDPRVCVIGKPGEKLKFQEEANMRHIVRSYIKEIKRSERELGKRRASEADFRKMEEVLRKSTRNAFGYFLDVPGYGSNDGSSTPEQEQRLDELCQMAIERADKERGVAAKILKFPVAREAARFALAAAVAAGLIVGVGKGSEVVGANQTVVSEEGQSPTEGGDLVAEVQETIDNLNNPEVESNQ